MHFETDVDARLSMSLTDLQTALSKADAAQKEMVRIPEAPTLVRRDSTGVDIFFAAAHPAQSKPHSPAA